jgi:hypothetical protein
MVGLFDIDVVSVLVIFFVNFCLLPPFSFPIDGDSDVSQAVDADNAVRFVPRIAPSVKPIFDGSSQPVFRSATRCILSSGMLLFTYNNICCRK